MARNPPIFMGSPILCVVGGELVSFDTWSSKPWWGELMAKSGGKMGKGCADMSNGKPMGGKGMRASNKQGRSQGNQDMMAVSKRPKRTGQK